MKLHVLEHESFEQPANIIAWANRRRHAVSYTRFHSKDYRLPTVDSLDFLVVMGGPMGVHDEAQFSWLGGEKRFIEACIKANKKVLGICLGAQICAHVLGARVARNREKEIGWLPMMKTSRHAVFASVPETSMVFQWHGDTFDLPKNAEHLARSEACDNQAYLWNHQVLGLQGHLEVGAEHVEEFLKHGRQEIAKGGAFVQSEAKIRKHAHHALPMQAMLNEVLDSFVS